MIKIQGMRYMSDFEAKKAMTDAGRKMAEKGYVIATDGSLSVRIGPNAVWITAEDAPKGSMTQDMMVKVDLDGKPMMGSRVRELPEEMRIHLKIYRENPDIRAVIHGYPPAAVGMGMRGLAIEGAGFTKTLRKLGSVPVIPYLDVDRAAQAVGSLAGTGKGVLLQDNGCMAWGENPLEAFYMLEAMEYYGTVMQSLGTGSEGRTAQGFRPGRSTEAAGRSEADRVEAARTIPPTEMPRLTGVTELVKPGFSKNVTSDVIHQTMEETKGKPALVTEKPKADVMAEVVRRTMQNYHL